MRRRLRLLCADNTILIVSAILALVSCFIVPPDARYAGYVHVSTIAQLVCLMIVVCGMQRIGVFRSIGARLLSRVCTQRGIVMCLVALTFVSAMFITNDVALVTFIPFAISVLIMAGMQADTIFVCTLMTVAANMGSMLTPIGNAHNLYLKAVSGMSTLDFLRLMAPYSAVAAVLLVVVVFVVFSRRGGVAMPDGDGASLERRVLAPLSDKPAPDEIRLMGYGSGSRPWRLGLYAALFVICLLAVGGIVPLWAMILCVPVAFAFCDRRVFLTMDWGLPLTFVMFFVFIGNMRRIPAFLAMAEALVGNHPLEVAVGFSQIISNVPTTLLLTGFSGAWKPLIIGTNLGGMGTLIASMASLVSYKNVTMHYPHGKTRYLLVYSAVNVVFLAVLVAASWAMGY